MLTSVELFSGCGGLAKGLENAGFKHRAFVEFNKWACQSLRLNFQPEVVYERDVRTFDFSSLGNVDLVAGGPPCQPFSLGGLAKAFEDSRDMFPQAARAIHELRPQAFLFENVKGLLRGSFKRYFDYIIARLSFPDEQQRPQETWQEHLARLEKINHAHYRGLQYAVDFKLLNAADYGVPQIRERVFIVGIRMDVKCQWTWPLPTTLKPSWKTIAETIRGLPSPQSQHNIPDHIFIGGARAYPGHTGSDINRPSKTIKAGAHGVPGGENMFHFPDSSVRYMTVHEAKLIQTFPPAYKICGGWSEALRQIGNAVPVRLAEILGRHLASLLTAANRHRITQTSARQKTVESSVYARPSEPVMIQLSLFEPSTLYLVHKTPVTLLGTYRKTCREWITANNLYNYPVSDIELESIQSLRSVCRLILKHRNDAPLFFAVNGYDVVDKKTLAKLGYTVGKSHPACQKYILYKLKPLKSALEFDEKNIVPIIGKGIKSLSDKQ